jgi:hypothetical protein
MPRLSYVTNPAFIAGKSDEPNNDCLDFCRDCWDRNCHEEHKPEGLDEKFIDEDCEHPPYEHENYHCECCGKLLEEEDN